MEHIKKFMYQMTYGEYYGMKLTLTLFDVLLFFFICERLFSKFYYEKLNKIHIITCRLFTLIYIILIIYFIYLGIKNNHFLFRFYQKNKVKINDDLTLSLIQSLKENSYEKVYKIVNSPFFDKSIIDGYHYIHEAMLLHVDDKIIDLLLRRTGDWEPSINLSYIDQYNENTLFVASKNGYKNVISQLLFDIHLSNTIKKESLKTNEIKRNRLKIINNVNVNNESLFYTFINRFFYNGLQYNTHTIDLIDWFDWFILEPDLYFSKDEFFKILYKLNDRESIKLLNLNIVKKSEYINHIQNNESILTICAKNKLYNTILYLLDSKNIDLHNFVNSTNHEYNFVNIIYKNIILDEDYEDDNKSIYEIIKKLYSKKYKFYDGFVKMVLESKNKELIKIILENQINQNNDFLINKEIIKYIFTLNDYTLLYNLINKNDLIKNKYIKYLSKKVKKYNIKKINHKNIDFLNTFLQFYKKEEYIKEKECVICLENDKSHFIQCKKCKNHYHVNCLSDYFHSCKDDKCCYCRNSINFALLN